MSNLQITFRHVSSSDRIEQRVRERAAKLDEHFGRIVTCHVAIEDQKRPNGSNFRCRIDLVVPNLELVAESNEESGTQEEVAVDDAFDQIARRLDAYVQRSHWDVKQHEGTPHARVAKLMVGEGPGSGYGFLATHDGREIYFHEHSVLNANFHKLEVGTEVRFAEEDGDKGPQASTVAMTKRRSNVTTTTRSADEIPESV